MIEQTQTLGRRERRKLKTREQLKDATIELLLEIGFDSLTIQKITDRADLARATFYLHFGDVEEAVWAVIADRFSELMQVMWDVNATEPKQIRYEKWVRVFTFVGKHRDLMEVVLGAKGHIKLIQRLQMFMTQSIESDMKSGRVSRTTDLPIPFEAQFYSGAVLNTLSWWLAEEPHHTPEEIAQMVYKIILREPPLAN